MTINKLEIESLRKRNKDSENQNHFQSSLNIFHEALPIITKRIINRCLNGKMTNYIIFIYIPRVI